MGGDQTHQKITGCFSIGTGQVIAGRGSDDERQVQGKYCTFIVNAYKRSVGKERSSIEAIAKFTDNSSSSQLMHPHITSTLAIPFPP